MKPAEALAELRYPLTQLTLVVPMLTSWLLFSMALAFGLFGLFLLLVTLFPFFAYLMRVLDERAAGRPAPAFDAELMQMFGSPISLFPFVIGFGLVWLTTTAAQSSVPVAWLVAAIGISGFPAMLGVLSLTRSPLEALNPAATYRFIHRTGGGYLLLAGVISGLVLALVILRQADVYGMFLGLFAIYTLFVMYGMTGGLCAQHRLDREVDIPAPLPVTREASRRRRELNRESVATHAYGFASRGNRAGAFKHIREEIDKDPDPDGAWDWYFNRMLRWDDPDHALFFAQIYLQRLLEQQDDVRAIKLVGQCLHANAQFRPASDDRSRIAELLAEYQRDDLLKRLDL